MLYFQLDLGLGILMKIMLSEILNHTNKKEKFHICDWKSR